MPVPSNTQLASYKVAYRAGQCKKPHTLDEELILPSTIDMVSTMIDKAIASNLKVIPLSDNTIKEAHFLHAKRCRGTA